MKIDLAKLQPLLAKINRYRVLLFALVFLGIYGFLTVRTNQFTLQEPTQQAISERLQSVKRITIDKDSINKLKQLEEQNVEVRSLLNNARNNPFSE